MPRSIDAQTYHIRQVRDALTETGELIAAVRKERGWSQSELGQRLGGIDRRHISAMEKGDANTDFGLVVSALWVLDIPVLETLSTGYETPASLRRPEPGALSTALATRLKKAGRRRRKVIDNDF